MKVELTSSCVAHQLGAPHLSSPCWSGKFDLPSPGTVELSEAFSGTTVPRIPVSTILDITGISSTVGGRSRAVQGTLDRSGLQLFTRVPRIYNDVGLTTARLDFRGFHEPHMVAAAAAPPDHPLVMPDGAAYLDWEHGPGLVRPYPQHPHAAQAFWNPALRSTTYFADWRADEFQLHWIGAQPFSFCPRLDQLFASPRRFRFSGAGLGGLQVERPAPDLIDTGTRGPGSEFRVGPANIAAGRFQRVLP